MSMSVDSTSSEACRNRKYDVTDLPKASVVISYHDNERLFNILHTVKSILQKSPPHLLNEIILVDDSTKRGKIIIFI